MERQAGEAAGIRRALAGQLGADIDLDHAVGKVAMHDGKARRVGTARLPQAAFLLILGEFDRQAVAAIPQAARGDHQIAGERLRDRRVGLAAARARGRRPSMSWRADRLRRPSALKGSIFFTALSFGFFAARETLGSHRIIDQIRNCDLFMNEIDLKRFDLNLLAVFEVLMRERSVTRAAGRLGRTQSAVSHSLSRLREQLGDPLLIKGGRRMEPTAFALEFIEQVRPLLRGIERVLSPRHQFRAGKLAPRLPAGGARFCARLVHRSSGGSARRGAGRLGRMDGPARDDAAGNRRGTGRHRHFSRPDPPAGGRRERGYRRAGMALLRQPRPSGVPQMGRPGVGALAAPGGPRGRSAREPGQYRRRRCRPHANDRRVGAQLLGHRARPGRLRSVWPPCRRRRWPARSVPSALESRRVPFAIDPIPHVMLWSAGRSQDPEIAWLRNRLRAAGEEPVYKKPRRLRTETVDQNPTGNAARCGSASSCRRRAITSRAGAIPTPSRAAPISG